MPAKEKDVEDMDEVPVPRSLSLRQWVGLLFLLYFGSTGTLFFLVEKGLAEQANILDVDAQSLDDETSESEPVDESEPVVGPELRSESAEQAMLKMRTEQVKLKSGEEVFAAHGLAPQLSWVGDRYAMVFSHEGLRLTYSRDGVNWSEPIAVHNWEDPSGLGSKGSILRRKDGSFFLIFAKPEPEESYEVRLFSTTSEDGVNWSPPSMLSTEPIQIWQIYGISIIETTENKLLLAFCGDEFGLATMASDDGVNWEGPDRRRSLEFPFGSISITEREGKLHIAYVDQEVVWVGSWEERYWQVSKATPKHLFSYFGGTSMVHLGNGSIIVAFDHLNILFLCLSNDTVHWSDPVRMTAGSMPSIAPVGNDTCILAYNGGGGIYVTLTGEPHPSPTEKSGDFQITFPDLDSDLYSSDSLALVYNRSKKGSSMQGWTNDRFEFVVFDSSRANFTLFGGLRQGFIPRVRKYTQSTGSVVWRMSLKYENKRLNVYAGGTFGSESIWTYSEVDDSWTIHFIDAEYEEWDLTTEDFTDIGEISFTAVIQRVPE